MKELTVKAIAFMNLKSFVKNTDFEIDGGADALFAINNLIRARGEELCETDYPKLKAHASVIGFANISRKMLANYNEG